MQKAQPKVSIIIPCWNAENYVRDAIGSCIGQSYKNVEIVVVNDGSTDESQAIISEYRDQIVSISTENNGPSKARNIGFEASTGELIKFLDADDYLWSGAIARQVDHMCSLKDNEFSVGESFRYQEDKNLFRKYPQWNHFSSEIDQVACFVRVPPPTTNTLYRRNSLKKIGGFDNYLITREEVDLFFRYVLLGNMPRFLPYPIFVYRDYVSPERVSSMQLSEGYLSDLNFLRRACNSLDQVSGVLEFEKIKEALALGIWNMGRTMLRGGLPAEAKLFFELAEKCNNKNYIEGRFIYRFLVNCGNPMIAESVLNFAKNIFRRN